MALTPLAHPMRVPLPFMGGTHGAQPRAVIHGPPHTPPHPPRRTKRRNMMRTGRVALPEAAKAAAAGDEAPFRLGGKVRRSFCGGHPIFLHRDSVLRTTATAQARRSSSHGPKWARDRDREAVSKSATEI